MKQASVAFVLLLLGAHGAGDPGQRLGQPLSLFRDGEQGWLGYLLFAFLLLIGLLYMRALIRAGKEEEAVTAGLAALLLLIVAVTPSFQGLHLLCSLILLLLLFAHYGRLLRQSGSPWLILHGLAPFLLVLLSGCHSYGLWQKSLIVYMVVLANVRSHLLGQRAASRPLPVALPRALNRREVNRRRKLYQLEQGRGWARKNTRAV
jgi:hypothetical protein